MKVLIVDDEKNIRSSIRLLLDWQRLQFSTVLEAKDGGEAARIIASEQPELVITDIMMPHCNGVKLMEWMEANAAGCKKIVISGHSDFEYVRHTLKYGGIDYLLKPIVKKQLEEAVGRAAESWRETNRQKQLERSGAKEAEALRTVYRDKMLSSLIAGPEGCLDPAEQAGMAREFPRLATCPSCRIALLNYGFSGQAAPARFGGLSRSLAEALRSLCGELVEERGAGAVFHNLNGKNELGVLIWDRPEAAGELLAGLQRRAERELGADLLIGLSACSPYPEAMAEAYRQARHALRQRDLMKPARGIYAYEYAARPVVGTLRFREFEEALHLAVKSGRPDRVASAMREWMEVVARLPRISPEQLELWWNEFKAFRLRWLEEWLEGPGAKLPFSPNELPDEPPLDAGGRFSAEHFERTILRFLLEMTEAVSASRAESAHSMQEIARYIESNYRRNITLQEIAGRFYLNGGYVSRKFKQVMNENVIDYLNRIRIEKSKVLLDNPNIKIAKVAQEVGYQDEKYYSRVFKKLEGMSPKEYRVLRE